MAYDVLLIMFAFRPRRREERQFLAPNEPCCSKKRHRGRLVGCVNIQSTHKFIIHSRLWELFEGPATTTVTTSLPVLLLDFDPYSLSRFAVMILQCGVVGGYRIGPYLMVCVAVSAAGGCVIRSIRPR